MVTSNHVQRVLTSVWYNIPFLLIDWIEPFSDDSNLVCFVAARNRVRQQVADHSPQRHATLPAYYKILLRTEKVLLQYYSVLQSTNPVLLCTTKYYSSTTLYYTVLLQYYSVLQSTAPVLLCTTKYYSSTTLYYKVLLQYYSVLQSTTPVLLCTTKYYKVLLQYYSVLQSTNPVLLCTTKYYSSTTLHTWNVIYNARSNMRHSPNSPNTAPATKNESHDWSLTQMKRYLQCAEQHAS